MEDFEKWTNYASFNGIVGATVMNKLKRVEDKNMETS